MDLVPLERLHKLLKVYTVDSESLYEEESTRELKELLGAMLASKQIELADRSDKKEYWRLLNKLSGRKRRGQGVPESAVDDDGEEKFGADVRKVWEDAFRNLGTERWATRHHIADSEGLACKTK